MARPITWQNVNGGTGEVASRMLERGGRSIDDGFNIFNRLLENTQQVRTDNRNTQIDNNTMKARDFLSSIQDPDEMARVQASGEFQDMVQGFGGMVDKNALRGAGEERLTGLRQAQTANREYQDSETRFGNREAREAHDMAIAEGRFDDALKIRGENDFLNKGEMTQQQVRAEQAQTERDWVNEQRVNSREDRARAEKEREAKKANERLRNTAFSSLTGPLTDGETYTQRKLRATEMLNSEEYRFMSPTEKRQLKQNVMDELTFNEAVAAGDQAKIDKFMAPIERERGRNVFYAHQTREADDGTVARGIVDDYSSEDEDTGLATLLNEPNGDTRMQVNQGIQAALNGQTRSGEVLVEGGIPESYIRMAMDGVKGGDWKNWDNAFEDQLRKVVQSDAFLNDYEGYVDVTEKYDRLKAGATSAARNGEPAASTGSGNPQRPDIGKPTPEQATPQRSGPANAFSRETPGRNARGPAVPPRASTGSTEPVSSSERPPIPTAEEIEAGEVGMDVPMGELIPNMWNRLSNARQGWNRETLVKNVDEVGTLIKDRSVSGIEKARLKDIVQQNPETLQYMSADERNVLRNILGARMVDPLME